MADKLSELLILLTFTILQTIVPAEFLPVLDELEQEVFSQSAVQDIAVSGSSQINFATESDFLEWETEFEQATVSRVVDGDTIELSDGRKLRYIGIDTPETVDPRKSVECFGKAASEVNKALILEKKIWMQKDVTDTDRYGRLLRYVYVEQEVESDTDDLGDNSFKSIIFINHFLVEHGYAHASSYPPDVRYDELFMSAEKTAREQDFGLWGACEIH